MTRSATRFVFLFVAVLSVLVSGPARAGAKGETYAEIARSEDLSDFLELVAGDLDKLWGDALASGEYDSPTRFIVVHDEIETACGPAEPGFYNAFFCSLDGGIYADPVLMDELSEEFGPFAAAVVVAHEWGHHVQDQLGLLGDSITVSLTDPTSLQNELQADCLAGTWAAEAAADDRLEPGDLDRAVLMMAAFLGDGDHLPIGTHDDPSYLDQQHGDGALRAWWFLQGFNGGMEVCGL